jgi:hypothetical protein
MRNAFRSGATVTAFLILAGVVMAQGDWYEHRDERYRGEHWRARIFAEVKEDLDHVQSRTFPVGKDEYRLVRAKQELDELQNDLAAHRYNEAKLDEVVGTMQKVVADNRMSARDRDILNDDVQRLRDYREHHEHWAEQ